MLSEKIYCFLFAVTLIIISGLGIGLAFGWTTPLEYLQGFLNGTNERWILGILGIFGVIAGFILVRNIFIRKVPTQTEVVITSLGKINITLDALENMVVKVAKKIQGVKEVKPKIKVTNNGIAVFLKLILTPDVSIPDITTEVQDKTKDYFSKTTGITVEEVKILVAKTNSEIKSRVE